MELLTEELKRKIPPCGSTSDEENPMVICKFFTPDAGWTWYVIDGEEEKNDFLFFGYVVGIESELGYFRLSELKEMRGAFRLPVERDLYFQPKRLYEVMKLHP